jgi:hypothetical protein
MSHSSTKSTMNPYGSGYDLFLQPTNLSEQSEISVHKLESSPTSSPPPIYLPSPAYTPVTGRISRAKKGVPIHTCDICRPVKVWC